MPPLGTAKDGKPCLTVRDFAVVDMDQSDNVVTDYLLVSTDPVQVAQNTKANRAKVKLIFFYFYGGILRCPSTTRLSFTRENQQFPGAQVIINGSDNRLLAVAMDSATGCTPWMAPDLADNGNPLASLPLDELLAAFRQAQPVALVPALDPMTVTGGTSPNLLKVNAYRAGVFQKSASTLNQADTTLYCQVRTSISVSI